MDSGFTIGVAISKVNASHKTCKKKSENPHRRNFFYGKLFL